MHLNSNKIAEEMSKLPAEILGSLKPREHSGDEMVAALDKAGIHKAHALSQAYMFGLEFMQVGNQEYDLVKMENDFTAEQVARHPDRLVPFLSINPLKDYALAEMERCVSQLDIHALKLHFTNSDVDLRKPEHLKTIKELLTRAAELQLPTLLHFRSRNPEFGVPDMAIFLEQIVAALPTLKVQMAHLGDWGAYTQVTRDVFDEIIRAFDANPALDKSRFYVDISAVFMREDDAIYKVFPKPTPEDLDYMAGQIRRWGLDHLLFGTDWPIIEPGEYARLVMEKLPLTDDEFKTLFSNKGMI
jgi:predicted TIM-barrel fold metal-dependent hydrolase